MPERERQYAAIARPAFSLWPKQGVSIAPCMAHGNRSPYTTLQYRITRPGQRDENGSYAPTPRSASCRRTRRQGSARNTQTEPCQSVEAGTAAQVLPSQADARGYFAPRRNSQLRWTIIENIPASVEHCRERASAPNIGHGPWSAYRIRTAHRAPSRAGLQAFGWPRASAPRREAAAMPGRRGRRRLSSVCRRPRRFPRAFRGENPPQGRGDRDG